MKTWGWVCLVVGLLTITSLPGLVLIGAVLLFVAYSRERRERPIEKLMDGLPDLRVYHRPNLYDPDLRAYHRIKRKREREAVQETIVITLPDEWVRNDPSMGWGLCQFYVAPEHVMSGHRTVEQQRLIEKRFYSGM